MENQSSRRRHNETKKENIEQRIRELEQELQLQSSPQRHQPEKISELTLEQYDQLTLFTLISNDRTLENKVCRKLPIVDIVDSMGSFVAQKYKKTIKEIEMNNGNAAAAKMLITLAMLRNLKTGWSCQLLQAIKTLDLKDVEELISPNQADLEDFNKRIGIPCNSLLDKITEELRAYCGILISPMGKKDEGNEVVPVVHPELCVSEDHFKKDTAFIDVTSGAGRKAYKFAARISFNDITESNVQTSEYTNAFSALMRKHHALFLFLIGAAGSGKTTISKRMVKTWIEENKMAFLIPFAQIDKSQRLSLKNLLTKFLFSLHNQKHEPSEEDTDQAFSWILANQDKCLLIFDGLDQSSFDISNQPIGEPDRYGEYFPGDLMSLLMSRKFLPSCRLVLTSRGHSLGKFGSAVQPQIVVVLNDLSRNDVEKLMDHYLEQGMAGEIVEKLRTKSPRIYQLLSNPLFLRLVVMLNNEAGDSVWNYVQTTAKLFFELIDLLQMCAHHESGLGVDDVEDLNLRLAEMAFHKTMAGSVVFEQKDLEKYGLSGENVQDFLFGIMNVSSSSHNSLVVGLMIFYFNHQSTQEFFSARFALEKLAVGEFEKFVEKLLPRIDQIDDDTVVGDGEDSFAVLRLLTIGCINEMKSRRLDGEEILVKKNIFINHLCGHLRQIFSVEGSVGNASFVQKYQKQILADLLDLREEEVINEIRERLNDFMFWFNFSVLSPLEVAVHQEGFCHFIKHFTSNIERLYLDIREWNDKGIRRLFQAIQDSSPKIGEMQIWMEPHIQHINCVVAILPCLTSRLEWVFIGRDPPSQFCRKLKKEINDFDTFKIQSKELIVEVECGFSAFLKVALHPGKPPQTLK